MHEPAVALTDYALTIENAVLAVLLWCAHQRRASGGREYPGARSAHWFTAFFATVSLPSLLAGTFHGFIGDESSIAGAVLWRAVMIAIGLVAFVGANAAAGMWSPLVQRVVRNLTLIGFALYCVIVFFISQDYRYAIYMYFPATLFLLISFVISYFRTRVEMLLAGAVGLLLTFAAAAVQQSSLGIPALRLDHNALYHIVQAIALVLVYLGALAAIEGQPSQTARSLTTTGGR